MFHVNPLLLDVSCERIHMKNQALFSSKDKSKKIKMSSAAIFVWRCKGYKYEGISKSFEPNMERARNLDLFCFIFQRSPLPTPYTCPI